MPGVWSFLRVTLICSLTMLSYSDQVAIKTSVHVSADMHGKLWQQHLSNNAQTFSKPCIPHNANMCDSGAAAQRIDAASAAINFVRLTAECKRHAANGEFQPRAYSRYTIPCISARGETPGPCMDNSSHVGKRPAHAWTTARTVEDTHHPDSLTSDCVG